MLSITNTTSPLTAGAAGSPKRQPFGVSPEVDKRKKKLDSYKSLHPGKENIPPELQKLLHRKGRRGSPVKVGQRKVAKTFAKAPDSGLVTPIRPPLRMLSSSSQTQQSFA